jgi:tRNA(Phe) wybutosine-synthesizing methylase Tyw3
MNVRLNKLNREYPDTVKAYRWLKENKNTFSGRVYEPVLYHLNLKDSKYADLVENALGGARSSHFRASSIYASETCLLTRL